MRGLPASGPTWMGAIAAMIFLAGSSGCSSGNATPDRSPPPAAAAAHALPDGHPAAARLLPETPLGGLPHWVNAVAIRLDSLPDLIARAPQTVPLRTVDTYIHYQEFMEQYWGDGGILGTTPALAAAVDSAEGRFHTLMELVGRTPPPVPDRVAAAVDSVEEAHRRVLDLARGAGLPLDPHAAAAVGKQP